MKSVFYFLSFILITIQCTGQVNLVPNPSFEDYTICPTGLDQIDRVLNWSSYSESPDYINSCNNLGNSSVGIPNNSFGFQYAKDGEAYGFVITYDIPHLPGNYREYIGTELSQPLVIGNKYFVSAFISRSDEDLTSIATNHFGIKFLEQPYSRFSSLLPDNFAHIQFDSIINSQNNWVQLFGSFIADTAFHYLAIGNFYDNQHTDTIRFNGYSAGYYVDAVCVTTDSIFSRNWTSVEDYKYEKIQIIFDEDLIHILNVKQNELFIIYNSIGKEVTRGIATPSNSTFPIPFLSQGIYVIKTQNSISKKIIVLH